MKLYQFILCISLLLPEVLFSQESSRPVVIYADKKSGFLIEVYADGRLSTGNCNKAVAYKVRTKGVCPDNLVVAWAFSYYDCNQKEKTQKITIRIPKGKAGFADQTQYKVLKIKTMINNEVKVGAVHPPESFEITGDRSILEDDHARLSIPGERPGVRFHWTSVNEKAFKAEGASIQVRPKRTTTYQVRSEQDGFFSGTRSFVVTVIPKPEPPKDFVVDLPDQVLEGDTATLSVETPTPAPGVKWHWYKEQESSPFATGKVVHVAPSSTTRYWLQADLNGKKSQRRQVTVRVKPVPDPPTEFNIVGPRSVNEGSSAVLRISSVNPPQGIRWLWFIKGGKEEFAEGESVQVQPGETTQFDVVAVSYKKRSLPVTYELKVIVKSIAPEIVGNMRICHEESGKETYSIRGGRLGTGSQTWNWYEGSCSSNKLIAVGTRITIPKPLTTTTYHIRPNNDPSICTEFKVSVVAMPEAPAGLLALDVVCAGQSVQILANGTRSSDTKWLWYKTDAGGMKEQFIGEGKSIVDTVLSSTTYKVRSENNFCRSQQERTVAVRVVDKAQAPALVGKSQTKGRNYVLKQVSGVLPAGYNWVWYRDECNGAPIGTGEQISYRAQRKNRLFVRAEGVCAPSSCTELSFSHLPDRSRFIFVNFGLSASTPEPDLMSYNGRFTIGSNRIYVAGRAPLFLLRQDDNDMDWASELQADHTGIINYPANTNTYYTFNGDVLNSVYSASGGVLFGRKNVKFYLGAGYGKRDLYWGADVFAYAGDENLGKSRARNIEQSFSGPLIEGGFLVRLGFLNLLGGISVISGGSSGVYKDAHAGIGFTFNKN